ncbi:MAG: serine hydrolase [Pirellulaceae bacterium]|nr:serine hydrolase [Pirellulaceae bacterium]
MPTLRLSLGCLAFLIAATANFAVVKADETEADKFARLREKIQQALVDQQIPSLAVAVARDGKILWEQGFGWADRENRVLASEHTMYSLASISKPITATGLMLLVQRGELQLDDPVNQHLGNTGLTARVGKVSEATIRRLANHSSGLPLHYQFFYEDESFERPEFDESLRRYGVLMSAPGERFQYANFGYGVLDDLIRSKSGTSYAEFMRRNVFLPLGLTHTSVDVPAELQHVAAVRYGPNQTPLPFYTFDHPGASAVFSSAHDLVRFGMFHLHQRGPGQQEILDRHQIDEMQEPTVKLADGRQYGVGWFIDEDEHGYKTVSHTGGMGGVRTRLTLVPGENLVVVALCNASTSLPLEMTREILGAMLPQYDKQRHLASGRHEPNPQPSKPHCPPGLVGYWKGRVSTYSGQQQIEMWAKPDGDVQIKMGGQLKTLLSQSRLNSDVLTGQFAGDVGTDDANRRPYHLHLRLKLREETMNGSVTAISLPGSRSGNALSYWLELQRIDQDPTVRSLFDGHSLAGWRVLNKYDFERHGKVTVKDGAVILDQGSPATGIAISGKPPRIDYELNWEAKRIQGSDFFCGLTFPVNENYLSLIVGGWGGGVTGISNLDGMSAVENDTTDYREFEQDRWYRLRLRVTRETVAAWVDDEQIVDVTLKGRKLSIWWEQEPVRPLGFAAWYTKAAVRNLTLKRLDLETEKQQP